MSAWGDTDEYKMKGNKKKQDEFVKIKIQNYHLLCGEAYGDLKDHVKTCPVVQELKTNLEPASECEIPEEYRDIIVCVHSKPEPKDTQVRDKGIKPNDTKAQDWEKELANMIYDYNRNTDGLLFIEAKFHNKLEDFISNAIEGERERVLKEVNGQYVDMFGFDEDLDKYLGKIVEELEAKK